MNLRDLAVLVTLAVSLAGCFATPLAIVDLEADKVVVQADEFEAATAVAQKAKEGCAVHRRTPRYISSRPHCSGQSCTSLGTGYVTVHCHPTECVVHHLFACTR